MIKLTKFLALVLLMGGSMIFHDCKKDPTLPTLTTSAATNITTNSITSGGAITNDGGAEITGRGLCYGTTINPDMTNDHLASDKGSGSFNTKITGLLPNTLYHIRAYAINKAGTAYGNDITATTVAVTAPALTTVNVTSITITSAVSGGNITSDGNDSITVRGVCWAKTTAPTISDSKTTDGAGKGSFVSSITGLQPGNTYYVRAYATNSVGTSYGNELTFMAGTQSATLTTKNITSLTLNSAVSGGNITDNGGSAITAKGVCWSTTTGPTVAGAKTTDGTGSAEFTSNISGLIGGTRYYVRAYATNASGTAYGNELSFTTVAASLPTLTTAEATGITQTSAISGGTITNDGGAEISVSGICWSTTANPTTANSKTTDGTPSGSFASNLTGLSAGTAYHVRAYATNTAGTAYGNDVTFTTTSPLLPTVTTSGVSSPELTTAVSGGTIVSNGGGAISVSGICWSVSPDPTTADARTTNGSLTGSFTSNLTGLSQGTVYYVRAYATNLSGTAYGNEVIFSTKIADIDGNSYQTILIGTQLWMAENLKTTRFNDGTAIPLVESNASWIALSTPAYCWYNNDETTYKPLYGAIYNWFTPSTGNLCPTGWHAPSDVEFNTLELYLGVPQADINTWGWRGTDQGNQLKSTTGWANGLNGSNSSGFNAKPGGYRYGASGNYNDAGNLTYWWTTTVVPADPTAGWYRRVDGSRDDIYKAAVIFQGGKYVRCLKN